MKHVRLSALMLAVSLLAMTACGGSDQAPDPTPSTAPVISASPAESTAVPAAAEETVPETSKEGRVGVEVTERSEIYTDDDSGVTLLDFRSELPVVTLEGRSEATDAVNRTLAKADDLFVDGSDELEGFSGVEDFLSGAREEYSRRAADGDADYFMGYTLRRTVHIDRADENVLSFGFSETTYAGGAHGYNGVYAMNFDARTGASLSLEDLAEDPTAFLTALTDYVWEVSRDADHAAYTMGGYYPDYEQYLSGLLRDGNWLFDDKGMVILANPYELAPYASGLITFEVPYEWLRWQIREEYLPPESRADGALTGTIEDHGGEYTFLADDGTDGRGAAVRFTAEGRVEDLEISRVTYYEYANSFGTDGTLYYLSALEDGETLELRTWIPDVLPTLQIRFVDAQGEKEYLISQSGKDGSLVLMSTQPYSMLPAEIGKKLPFSYDLNGDGTPEVIDLTSAGTEDGSRWRLTVDGVSAGEVFALDARLCSLWIADADADGTAEIYFSGDMGSDDYVTCAWRGDTLEPILFTGESRNGADPAEQTQTADGLAVFSGPWLYLDSWSYQLGTYRAVRPYVLRDGVLMPDPDSDWAYTANRFALTVRSDLPVTLDGDGPATVHPGTQLTLLGTNGNTVRFTMDEGVTGTIELSLDKENGAGWRIDGRPEDEFFETLPYAG